MPGQFYFNDVTASTYGLVIGTITGWLDSPAVQVPTAIVSPKAGATQSGPPREQTRSIQISGYVRGSTPADARSKFEALKAATRTARVKLSVPDGRARHINAVRESLVAPTVAGQFVQRDLPVDIRFEALDPFFYDDSITIVTAPAVLPMGTAPVSPVLTVTGATVTSPIFTLRTFNNVIVGQMTFPALTLAPADTLIIDCALKTAKKNGTNVLAFLSGDFFKIDPTIHSNNAAASYPYITMNTNQLVTSYQRAWE